MAWYPEGVPDWCTNEELCQANYNIDKSYQSFFDKSQLETCLKETSEEFYNRNYEVLLKLIETTSK